MPVVLVLVVLVLVVPVLVVPVRVVVIYMKSIISLGGVARGHHIVVHAFPNEPVQQFQTMARWFIKPELLQLFI